jgi:VIT1/CCC1 family predicted Fe2+/Mn2+ transporter
MVTLKPKHRTPPETSFLGRLITPIDWLAETIFSILLLLTFMLAYGLIRFSGVPEQLLSHDSINEMLVGAVSAVLAWGLIDGIMYALLSTFERGESHRLLKEIKAASSEQDAVDIVAEELDYWLEPITSEDDRGSLYLSILTHLKNGKPRKIGLKGDDLAGLVGHVLVAVLAVIPSLLPFLLLRNNYDLAIIISVIVSFIVLYAAGFRWGKYTGANPWIAGLLIMSVAVALVLIAYLMGG